MASQVAYSSQTSYSPMSAAAGASASSTAGTGSPDENDRLLRHVSDNSGLRKEALDVLTRSARRGNGRLQCRDPVALFRALAIALDDPDWEARNKTANLATELIPKFGPQLSECMALLLPGLVKCLADIKVANRRATTQCLHTYMKAMGSANTEPVLRAIIRYGLESADPELQRNVCVSVPVLLTPDLAGGDFSQLVAALSRCLTSKDEAMANAALHAMEAIRSTLGAQLFTEYLKQLNPPLRRYYYQVSGHPDPFSVGGLPASAASSDSAALSRSPSMQRRPIPSIESASQQPQQQQQQSRQHFQLPTSNQASADFAFGCVPRHLVAQLDDQEDYSLRARAVEELRVHLRQMDSLETLVPHLERFLLFLHSLLDDTNFRVAIVTLDILHLLVDCMGQRLGPHIREVLAGIAKQMSDSKVVVRQAVMKLFILLMNKFRPQLVLSQLLDNLEHRNSRVRQETLNVTIAALVTFPSSDFELPRLCAQVAPALLDPKRQVRHAALEVMALVAQSLGSGRLQPLQGAVRDLEARQDGAGLFEAVMTRLSKRQLPRLNSEGLVEYAIPVPSSATRRNPGSANEDWVLQAATAGGGSGLTSAKSRPELVDLEAEATDRRRASAGRLAKGKLPWDDADSSASLPATKQQQQQQQQQQQRPAAELVSSMLVGQPADLPTGQSGYVTNGRVKKLADLPVEQPRKVKRFLDQAEQQQQQSGEDPSAAAAGGAPDARRKQQTVDIAAASAAANAAAATAAAAAEPVSPVPLKPQLARSAGKKAKRAAALPPGADASPAGGTGPADSGIGSSSVATTAPPSSRSSQIDPEEPQEEIAGSLGYIRHSASRKKAMKVFENAESGATGKSAQRGSQQQQQQQPLDDAPSSGSRYNPHQGATFRPNPSYQSEVVGRAYGDDNSVPASNGGFAVDLGGTGTGPSGVVRGRQQQRKLLRGVYTGSPMLGQSSYGQDDADLMLQQQQQQQLQKESDFNIVGKGVFEVQPAAANPLPRAEILSSGSSGGMSAAADTSPLAGVQGTAFRAPSGVAADDEEDAELSGDRGGRVLHRTLSNTLRESMAQKQKEKAERSSSRARADPEENLIRMLRENGAPDGSGASEQPTQRQQQPQQLSEADAELARILREEQLAISKRHSESIGMDSDNESQRSSGRNFALASLNRKVSDNSSPEAAKPPAPKRNLSRPPRPSPSQAEPAGAGSDAGAEAPAPAAAGPLPNPDRSYQEAVGRLQEPDWQAKCDGLQLLQRIAANHPDTISREMHTLTLAVIAEVKNLRSQVCRLAIQTLGELFGHVGKRMDAELELCAKILLQKGSETNHFIQEVAVSALMSMVESCNNARALAALIQGGASHKSAQIRSLCAQTLFELADRMGPGRVLSGVKDVTDRLLPAAAAFCLDSSQEARYWGRMILHPLLNHQDFDALLNRHVPAATMRNLKEVIENLRAKGVGEQPPSAFSAGARSRRGNSAGSADSGLSGSSFYSAGAAGQSAPSSGGTLGRKGAGSNSRLSEAAADLVKAACQRLNAPDWKERLAGIDQLAELSDEKPDLVGQCIVKFMDVFAPRLGDSNSKVQQHALETSLTLVPALRNYLPSVANTLVQNAAPVLSSKSPEIAGLASQLLDTFISEVDSEKMVQPLVQAVATGNPRSKPELVDKLAALADRLAPRKPKLAQLHLEPELFRLLVGLASAPGAGSVPLKASAYRLAQTLDRHAGGSELVDRARANPQCTPGALTLLEEALRQH